MSGLCLRLDLEWANCINGNDSLVVFAYCGSNSSFRMFIRAVKTRVT